MLIKYVLCLLLGIIFGSSISSGIFALVNSVKLLPNFADKTHTKHNCVLYETAILLGATSGNLLHFLGIPVVTDISILNNILLGIIGLLVGIFIGCLALSLAEKLGITALVSRRFKLHTGIGTLIFSLALGKMFGNLLYFFLGWYKK